MKKLGLSVHSIAGLMAGLELAARAGLVPFVSIPIFIRYVSFEAPYVDRQTFVVDTNTHTNQSPRLSRLY